MPYGRGTGALILGIIVAISGFFLYNHVACTVVIGEFCLEPYRPYETVGLLMMIFGGVLFVVSIILLAMGGRTIAVTTTPPPSPTPSKGKYCGNCGTLNPFEASYCNSCGRAFAEGSQ